MGQRLSDGTFAAPRREVEPLDQPNGRSVDVGAANDPSEQQREQAYQRETILDLVKVFCWLLVLTLISLAAFMVFGLR